MNLIVLNPELAGAFSFDFLRWAFTSFLGGNWNPLLWLSFGLDYSLFGADPAAFHATNVLLHLINSLLLFYLLSRYTNAVFESFFVAAVFALHPQHVEAVAWVSSRKDLLSTLFGLFAIQSYLAAKGTRSCMPLVGFFMALSLMVKPTYVTLPFLLVLLDIWPLNNIAIRASWSDLLRQALARLLEKWPLLLLTVAGCLIGYWSHAAVDVVSYSTLSEQIVFAVRAYGFYLQKFFLPKDLAFLYPASLTDFESSAYAALAIFCVSLFSFITLRRFPIVFVGWFWFLGALVPSSGIIQFGPHDYADRFSYFPHVGLSIAVIWPMFEWVRLKGLPLRLLNVCGISVLLIMACLSWLQTAHWRNDSMLLAQARDVSGDHSYLLAQQALIYQRAGLNEQAVLTNRRAIDMELSGSSRRPKLLVALYALNATLLYDMGEWEASRWYVQQGLEMEPSDSRLLRLKAAYKEQFEQ